MEMLSQNQVRTSASHSVGTLGPVLPAAVIAAGFALLGLRNWLINPEPWLATTLYNRAGLAFNYIQFGAIRRGLAGTVLYLLHADPATGPASMFALAALALGALFAVTLARGDSMLGWAISAVGIGAIFAFWGADVGRVDLLIGLIFATAVTCLRRDRFVLAGCALSVGLFVHEMSLIYGLPLCAAMALADGTFRTSPLRRAIRFALPLLAAVLVYAAMSRLPHASAPDITDAIHQTMQGASESALAVVDIAIYVETTSGRALATAMCENFHDPNYVLHGLTGVGIVALAAFAFAGQRARLAGLAFLAGAIPFVFLWFVARDNARWMPLSILATWLVCAPTLLRRTEGSGVAAASRIGAAALVALLIWPNLAWAPAGIFTPSSVVDNLAARVGFTAQPGADLCDLDWHSTLER